MQDLCPVRIDPIKMVFSPASDARKPCLDWCVHPLVSLCSLMLTVTSPDYLVHLPTEIVREIFDIMDVLDCFLLAITCRRCWTIGVDVLREWYLSTIPRTAGDRLLLIPQYSEPGNIPLQVKIDDGDEELLTESCLEDLTGYDYFFQGRLLADSLGWDDIEERYSRPGHRVSFPYDKYYKMGKWYASIFKAPQYDQRNLVLRNLTSREYLRGDAVSNLSRELGGVTLGHIVLLRILWPADKNMKKYGAGVWYGHRFDIVEHETFERALREESEWKEITDDVSKDMRGYWEEMDMLPKKINEVNGVRRYRRSTEVVFYRWPQ